MVGHWFGEGELGAYRTYGGTSSRWETGLKHRRVLAGILWIWFQQHKNELEGHWPTEIRLSLDLSGMDCIHHFLPLDGEMGTDKYFSPKRKTAE